MNKMTNSPDLTNLERLLAEADEALLLPDASLAQISGDLISRLASRIRSLQGALEKANDLLIRMEAEYERDEECDYVKINAMIEEGGELTDELLRQALAGDPS
jgi:hypothetical protein